MAGSPGSWVSKDLEPVNFFLPSHPTMEEKTCKKKKSADWGQHPGRVGLAVIKNKTEQVLLVQPNTPEQTSGSLELGGSPWEQGTCCTSATAHSLSFTNCYGPATVVQCTVLASFWAIWNPFSSSLT